MVDTGIAMNVHVKDVFPILLCSDIPKLAIPLKLAYIEPAWHCSESSFQFSSTPGHFSGVIKAGNNYIKNPIQ